MKTIHIHQFDPVLYPRKVWVCFNATKEVLEERFEFNGTLIDELFKAKAATIVCKDKASNLGGFLVLSVDKTIDINSIAHEASHVADMIFDYIGEEANTDECKAYLIGWVAECIDKAMKFKDK